MDKSWLNGGYFANDVVAKLGEVTNGR
jgi:hypothetical protein